MGREKHGFEVLQQDPKGTVQRLPPCDKNIVIAAQSIKWKHGLGCRLEAPAGAVPVDRSADLAARRETEPHRSGYALRRPTNLQSQAGGNPPDSSRGSQEILALLQPFDNDRAAPARICDLGQADSLLRPWARRRASTLRPPTVAIRERNPWRRLRTILLG